MSATPQYPVTVEPGPQRPPTRAELLSLVDRLLAHVQRITTPYGWVYRKNLVNEAVAALDAAKRFGQLVVVAVAVLLGAAACATAQGSPGGGAPNCTAVTGNWSPMDADQRLQMEMRLRADGHQPWRNVGTDGRRETYCLAFPAHVRITGIRTFFATDRSDKAEAMVHVVINGYQVVTRSEHKETDGVYDAWKSELQQYATGDQGQTLALVFDVHSTVSGRTVTVEAGVIVDMIFVGQTLGEALDFERFLAVERARAAEAALAGPAVLR